MTCARCGTASPAGETPPPTWSCALDDPRGPQWLCEVCTRDNLRSIEGKLDEQWW